MSAENVSNTELAYRRGLQAAADTINAHNTSMGITTDTDLGRLAIQFDEVGMAARAEADLDETPYWHEMQLIGAEAAWHQAAQLVRKAGAHL